MSAPEQQQEQLRPEESNPAETVSAPDPVMPASEAQPAPAEEAASTATPALPDSQEETPEATEALAPADAEAPIAVPNTPDSTPVSQLWTLAKANGHPEIWGVTLADPIDHVPTRIILQKYLNANDGDLPRAKEQLTKTLEWRAKTKPLDLVTKVFSKAKFDGLGYVTKYVQDGSTEPEHVEVFTWNIYGAVKSIDDTFAKLEE